MFCNRCGSQVDEGAKFCPSCGVKFEGAVQPEAIDEPLANEAPLEETVQSKTTDEATVNEIPPAISTDSNEQPQSEASEKSDNKRVFLILGSFLLLIPLVYYEIYLDIRVFRPFAIAYLVFCAVWKITKDKKRRKWILGIVGVCLLFFIAFSVSKSLDDYVKNQIQESQAAMEKGDYIKAIIGLDYAIEKRPDSRLLLYRAIIKHDKKGHFEKIGNGNQIDSDIMSDLDVVIKRNDLTSPKAHVIRGQLYLNNEEYAKAIEDFGKVISDRNADGDDTLRAHLKRGFSYARQKDYVNAIEDFNKIINDGKADDKYKAKAFFYRGGLNLEQDNYSAAIADLTKAIEMNPDNSRAYAGRALAHIKLGHIAQAEADSAKVKELEAKEKK